MSNIPNHRFSEPEYDASPSSSPALEAFLPETTSEPEYAFAPAPAATTARPRKSTRIVVGVIVCAIGGVVGSAIWLNASSTPPVAATGSLRVESDPAGADLFVDGVSRGMTPMTITLLEGKHQILLKHGTLTQELPATVTRNTATVHHITWPAEESVPPPGLTGSVSIVSEPTTATVTVDGAARGATPLTVSNLPPGQHEVVLRSEAGTQRRTVIVEAGTTSSLVFTRATTASTMTSGWLAPRVAAPLQILEGGKLVGSTESERIMLPSGEHTLEFASDQLGFRTTKSVRIAPGQTASIEVELPRASVNINAIPWAQVWFDGQALGETPLGNVMATIGSHEIIFRHPQLGERRLTTVVTLKEPARATIDLTKR